MRFLRFPRFEIFGKLTTRALLYAAGVLALLGTCGCFSQRTAETIDYDSGAVETLRDEVESFDWDQ